VTNYGADTVSVIDEATDTVTATVPVGTGPAGVAVDPAARTAYVANYNSGRPGVQRSLSRPSRSRSSANSNSN
jgi:YVTN family beta-propeller protein